MRNVGPNISKCSPRVSKGTERQTTMLFLDRMSRLRLTLCGVELQNPVIAASGTYGYGIEFEKVADLNAIGGIVVKGLSSEPIAGNPPPRIWEAEGGMINSVGLQNIGARAFVRA